MDCDDPEDTDQLTDEFDPKARTLEIAAEFAARGDSLGWFEALYKESAGDLDLIPWADLEPNRFFTAWAEKTSLKGNGRNALVVGCGLGDDARYLHDLGFKVTAFDISPTAIEWAKRLHADTDIRFEVCDLFDPPVEWLVKNAPAPPAAAGGTDQNCGFDFVLEVYTIQPLPLEMRPKVLDALAAFVAPKGLLLSRAAARTMRSLMCSRGQCPAATFRDSKKTALSRTILSKCRAKRTSRRGL